MPSPSVDVDLRREQARLGARVPARLAHLARDQHARARRRARSRARAKRSSTAARASRPASRQRGNASRARATAASTAARVRHREAADHVAGSDGETLDRSSSHGDRSPSRPTGSGVTLTRSPARDAERVARRAARRTGAPSASSGTIVARKPSRPSPPRARASASSVGGRLAHEARQHELAALAHRGDRVARRADVGPAVERIDLVQAPEADLLEDAQRRHARSRSAGRSRPARARGTASRTPGSRGNRSAMNCFDARREVVGLAVGEAGEARAERVPEQVAARARRTARASPRSPRARSGRGTST